MSMPMRDLNISIVRCAAAPTPEEAKFELAGLGLGERDQLLHVVRRQRWLRDHDQRRDAHQRHVGEVLQRVVGQLRIERGVDRMRRDHGAEGVAVGRGLGDDVGADDGVGARLVLEDDRLTPSASETFCPTSARHQVGVAARRVGHDPCGSACSARLARRRCRPATAAAAWQWPQTRHDGRAGEVALDFGAMRKRLTVIRGRAERGASDRITMNSRYGRGCG